MTRDQKKKLIKNQNVIHDRSIYEHNGICLCTCVVYVWYGEEVFMLWFNFDSIDWDGNFRIGLRSFNLSGECECVVSVLYLNLLLLLFGQEGDEHDCQMYMYVCILCFVLFYFFPLNFASFFFDIFSQFKTNFFCHIFSLYIN